MCRYPLRVRQQINRPLSSAWRRTIGWRSFPFPLSALSGCVCSHEAKMAARCPSTYFSSTSCFWYSSYSSRVMPAAAAGSLGVASSSFSAGIIPDRGFPIMDLIRKAIFALWKSGEVQLSICDCGQNSNGITTPGWIPGGT